MRLSNAALNVAVERIEREQPFKREFRLADVLAALKLPAGTRLEFGGREWLQPFDQDAVLIATIQPAK